MIDEFEHAFDNHTHEEIVGHSFSENELIFDASAADGAKLSILYDALKQDHPCDCAKHITASVAEGNRQSASKPYQQWAKTFLV